MEHEPSPQEIGTSRRRERNLPKSGCRLLHVIIKKNVGVGKLNGKKIITLILLVIVTSVIVFLSCFEFNRIRGISRWGIVVDAEVIKRYTPLRSRDDGPITKHFRNWYIVYRFKTTDNRYFKGNSYVTKKTYENNPIGAKITITYNPLKPYQSSIGDLKNIKIGEIISEKFFLVIGAILSSFITIGYISYLLLYKKLTKVLTD